MWWKIALDLIGIGKSALEKRQTRKQAAEDSKARIKEAETEAKVNRIKSNTTADNNADLVTATQMDKTWKDEWITFIVMMPLAVASAVPFIRAFKNGNWEGLNEYFAESWKSLNNLPEWYPFALFLVFVAGLGLRSLVRGFVDGYVSKIKSRLKL